MYGTNEKLLPRHSNEYYHISIKKTSFSVAFLILKKVSQDNCTPILG